MVGKVSECRIGGVEKLYVQFAGMFFLAGMVRKLTIGSLQSKKDFLLYVLLVPILGKLGREKNDEVASELVSVSVTPISLKDLKGGDSL